MHRHINDLSLIGNMQEIRQKDQMARRGNRQKLRYPLHDGDKENVKERHGACPDPIFEIV